MKILALGYLGFESPRYGEWSDFGPDVLGMQLMPASADGGVRLRVDERHHRIAVHPGEIDAVAYLGWELRGRIEFADALKHLEAKGYAATLATPEELLDRMVSNMAWINDPAGFRHEIYYGPQHMVAPFVAGRPISGFVAGSLGLGHCVMVVPEITPELQHFATEVLNFSTFWTLGTIDMYRCNVRTHCLIYLPIPGMRGMEHFYLDLKHLDDVGRAYDICHDRKIVVKEFGRYVQDDDVSFYLRSPSGVDIQYAHGCELDVAEDAADRASLGNPPNSLVWGHQRTIPEMGSMIRKCAD